MCHVRMCDTVTPFLCVAVAVTAVMLFVISCDCVMYEYVIVRMCDPHVSV